MSAVVQTDVQGISDLPPVATFASLGRTLKENADSLTNQIVLWSFVAAVVLATMGFVVVAALSAEERRTLLQGVRTDHLQIRSVESSQ